jgi:hypothetical protein
MKEIKAIANAAELNKLLGETLSMVANDKISFQKAKTIEGLAGKMVANNRNEIIRRIYEDKASVKLELFDQ